MDTRASPRDDENGELPSKILRRISWTGKSIWKTLTWIIHPSHSVAWITYCVRSHSSWWELLLSRRSPVWFFRPTGEQARVQNAYCWHGFGSPQRAETADRVRRAFALL